MITPAYALTATERVLPRLALDFTTASLDPRVTFTRTGNTATVTNSSGYVVPINADLPRFDFDPITLACKGLLIEEARTNLTLRSDDFSNGTWAKANCTVTANSITSPDGTATGSTLTSTNSATASVGLYQSVTTAIGSTVSMYGRAGTANFIGVANTTGGTSWAYFNLATGAVGSFGGCTASIAPAGNGWYRCIIANVTRAGTNQFVIAPKDADPNISPFQGGTCASGNNIYIWGAQVEAAAFATSYIPTVASTVLRNADVASMTGTNFSSWYNATEGTYVMQLIPKVIGGSRQLITSANYVMYSPGTGGVGIFDGTNFVFSGTIMTVNSVQKGATSYGSLKLRTNLNGNAVTSSANYNNIFASATDLQFSTANSNWVQKVFYYPQQLTASEMQAFTK